MQDIVAKNAMDTLFCREFQAEQNCVPENPWNIATFEIFQEEGARPRKSKFEIPFVEVFLQGMIAKITTITVVCKELQDLQI